MIGYLAFYVGLSAASLAAVWPMVRMPHVFIPTVPPADVYVPVATFDTGGFS